eukprot:6194079-Pleurochrysis_carterae.AAC.2
MGLGRMRKCYRLGALTTGYLVGTEKRGSGGAGQKQPWADVDEGAKTGNAQVTISVEPLDLLLPHVGLLGKVHLQRAQPQLANEEILTLASRYICGSAGAAVQTQVTRQQLRNALQERHDSSRAVARLTADAPLKTRKPSDGGASRVAGPPVFAFAAAPVGGAVVLAAAAAAPLHAPPALPAEPCALTADGAGLRAPELLAVGPVCLLSELP